MTRGILEGNAMIRSRILLAFLSTFVATTALNQVAAAQRSDPSGATELESDAELLVELIGTFLPNQLDQEAVTRLVSMVRRFRGGDVERGLVEWQAFLKSEAEELGAENVAQIGSWLVRMSALENSPELADPADRVRFARAVTSRLRKAMAELEAARNAIGSGKSVTTRIVLLLPYERSQPGTVDVVVTLTAGQLDAEIERVRDARDSMSEVGEMESLRLQMAMDRMSKMMSTLSNLRKKISDTSSGITQNLK